MAKSLYNKCKIARDSDDICKTCPFRNKKSVCTEVKKSTFSFDNMPIYNYSTTNGTNLTWSTSSYLVND